MPAERIGMRDAREIIRLKFSGVSTHEIARWLGMARSTVRETLRRRAHGRRCEFRGNPARDSDLMAQVKEMSGYF